MKYFVKTRNWNQSKIAVKLLSFTKYLGVNYYQELDNDNKYWLSTNNKIKAWLILLYFLIIKPLSGGWTYIKIGDNELKSGYKIIN